MQRCPNCKAENYEGVLFCEKCGIALDAVSVSTKALGAESNEHLAAGGDMMSQDHVVMLHIKGYADPLPLQIHEQVVLGRISGEENGMVLVSLDGYDAENYGVSRRHAMFTRNDDQLLIRDLSSTNHVFLNGQQVIEQRDYILHDGDEISLGRLTFRLFFK